MERKPVNQEVLNKEVNLTGHDSSPAVNALTSNEFLTNKDVDNIDIAAALVEILRGQKIQSEEIARMKAFYDKEEKARRAWEEDQMKFIQEVRDRAERTKKATGEEADKLKAKGMKMWQEENQMAAARTANRRLELKKKMTEAPKVKVHSAGKNVLTEVNGAQTWVRVPEEFNYKSFKFVLKMDDFTELPDFVAAEYMRTQREKKRLSALDDVLAKQSKWEDVLKVAPEVDPTSAQIGTHVGYMEEHDNVKIE